MALRTLALNGGELIRVLSSTDLFRGLDEEEIEYCLNCSQAEYISYAKGEVIFAEEDGPEKMFFLIRGSVMIGHYSLDGKRSIHSVHNKPGDIFGYELLLRKDSSYGMYAEANAPSAVLQISKDFLIRTCEKNCRYHSMLITNMLLIVAQRSMDLRNRLEIMSCSTIRKKIATLLIRSAGNNRSVPEKWSADECEESPPAVVMGRQEMADFINVARPSLSRELMKMQDEDLITILGRKIYIKDEKALEGLLE